MLQVDFGPSYQFNKPVLITFDLNNAELAGHDVNQLSIWWYNNETGAWEKVPSTLDGHIISAYVTHFSIYGVGD